MIKQKLIVGDWKAFTFVELLVVMTIVAVLVAAGTVSYKSTARNSRNARRVADIESIRSALEICRAEVGKYPTSIYNNVVCTGGSPTTMTGTPKDPSSNNSYNYNRSSLTTYTLSYEEETAGGLVERTVTQP